MQCFLHARMTSASNTVKPFRESCATLLATKDVRERLPASQFVESMVQHYSRPKMCAKDSLHRSLSNQCCNTTRDQRCAGKTPCIAVCRINVATLLATKDVQERLPASQFVESMLQHYSRPKMCRKDSLHRSLSNQCCNTTRDQRC